MSNTQFAEVTSNDPFVQKLGRRAIGLLNDPTLERWQRERHIRKLQNLLLEHQAKQAAKANLQEAKKSGSKVPQDGCKTSEADVSQIRARRREFSQALPTEVAVSSEVIVASAFVDVEVMPQRKLRPLLSLNKRS